MPKSRFTEEQVMGQRRQTGEALALVGDPGGQPNPSAAGSLDHPVDLKIRSNRASARSFTCASTRTRLPQDRLIPMFPARSSRASCAGNGKQQTGGMNHASE